MIFSSRPFLIVDFELGQNSVSGRTRFVLGEGVQRSISSFGKALIVQ